MPTGDALIANCRDQAQVLRAAGVDLFALEMLFDIDVTLAMLEAVSEFDVPVIVGFTCGLSEHRRADGIESVEPPGPQHHRQIGRHALGRDQMRMGDG